MLCVKLYLLYNGPIKVCGIGLFKLILLEWDEVLTDWVAFVV